MIAFVKCHGLSSNCFPAPAFGLTRWTDSVKICENSIQADSVIHNQLDRKVVKSESSPTIFMGIYYGFTAILILFKGIYWNLDYSQLLQ